MIHVVKNAPPVVVLAGGFGTRLRLAVPDLPKPMAPVRGRPFLDYLVRNLYRQAVREIVFSLHHQADVIQNYLAKESFFPDLRIRSVVEPSPLGTGGGVRFAAQSLNDHESFFVCNGDTWISDGINQFSTHPGKVSMALVEVPDASRYGSVQVGDSGQVSKFLEKENQPKAGWINAGLYHLSHADLKSFPVGQSFSLERDLFPKLIEQNKIVASPIRSEFIDIGIPEDYEKFSERVAHASFPKLEGL